MTVDLDQAMANMPNALAVLPPAAMRQGFLGRSMLQLYRGCNQEKITWTAEFNQDTLNRVASKDSNVKVLQKQSFTNQVSSWAFGLQDVQFEGPRATAEKKLDFGCLRPPLNPYP